MSESEAPESAGPAPLLEAEDLARGLAASAEACVEQRMASVMEFDRKLAALKALQSETGDLAADGLKQQRQTLDDEVRALVEMAGNLSNLSEKLTAAKQAVEGALAERSELERTRNEVSSRAGEMLKELSERDARIATLEQQLMQAQLDAQAASEAPKAAPDPVDTGEGDPVDDGESLDIDVDAPDADEIAAAFQGNPLVQATERLEKEKYAGRASVRLRELLVAEPHHLDDLIDVSGLPRREVIDCLESFVALGVARLVHG